MNQIAPIGHNNPPDPIESVIAEYDGVITEAHNWADGEPVTDEAGMIAVDAVIKEFKAYKSALTKAGKERTDPLHKAWKAEVAAVKVYTDDADMLQKALIACVAPFKAKLAAQKEAERKAAWEAAEKAAGKLRPKPPRPTQRTLKRSDRPKPPVKPQWRLRRPRRTPARAP